MATDENEPNEIQQVDLFPVRCPLTLQQFDIFRQNVVPLSLNDNLSDKMMNALEILHHILDNN